MVDAIKEYGRIQETGLVPDSITIERKSEEMGLTNVVMEYEKVIITVVGEINTTTEKLLWYGNSLAVSMTKIYKLTVETKI